MLRGHWSVNVTWIARTDGAFHGEIRPWLCVLGREVDRSCEHTQCLWVQRDKWVLLKLLTSLVGIFFDCHIQEMQSSRTVLEINSSSHQSQHSLFPFYWPLFFPLSGTVSFPKFLPCAAMRKMRGSRRHPLNKAAWPFSVKEMPKQQIPTCCWGSAAAAIQAPGCLFPLMLPFLFTSSLLELPSLRIHPLGWRRIKCMKGSKRQKNLSEQFPRMYWCKILLLITLILRTHWKILQEQFFLKASINEHGFPLPTSE